MHRHDFEAVLSDLYLLRELDPDNPYVQDQIDIVKGVKDQKQTTGTELVLAKFK